MTTKPLGQVLYEAEYERELAEFAAHGISAPYAALTREEKEECERIAQAVAAVVREQCAHDADKDAARYRALRGSLTGKPGCSVTFMPRLLDPFDSMVTYTPDGLDKTLNEAIKAMK